jgi:hypothetical protein
LRFDIVYEYDLQWQLPKLLDTANPLKGEIIPKQLNKRLELSYVLFTYSL